MSGPRGRVWWEADHMLYFSALGPGLCVLCLPDHLPREALSATQSRAQVEGPWRRQGWVHSSMASCWPPIPINVAQPPLVTWEDAYSSSRYWNSVYCCRYQFLQSASRCPKAGSTGWAMSPPLRFISALQGELPQVSECCRFSLFCSFSSPRSGGCPLGQHRRSRCTLWPPSRLAHSPLE